MAGKRNRRLVREGEPSQKTDRGLEIPIPERSEFFGALDKASKKNSEAKREKPSRSSQEKR
jgi:hypothetical protein